MRGCRVKRAWAGMLAVPAFLTILFGSAARGDEPNADRPAAKARPARELLSAEQWQRLDQSVDRGLEFLASVQQPDGSFDAPTQAQPGITALCVLAFLSRGHLPHEGKHGDKLDRAIAFVLGTQRENGLLFHLPVEGKIWPDDRQKTGAYNHAIAGLMLSEVYGMTPAGTPDRIGEAIRAAIKFTRGEQRRDRAPPLDQGGWRYLVLDAGNRNQSDMSVTSWQVMFLRSARNAEFEVPVETIDAAMDYVRRAFDPRQETFSYGHLNLRPQTTRAMAGSGILMLSFGGEHDTAIARTAGNWVLKLPFDDYNRSVRYGERYHYSAYYCSQAMFQLGGDYWTRFYPRFMNTLLENQRRNGAWDAEADRDRWVGNTYTTALTILAL
ncbi:MAG TPA: hypothetical protein VL475_04840, partial [Planctomycetaceae bacterium]|nr:hypothetical protein [Planctomycetaceae bacterium]